MSWHVGGHSMHMNGALLAMRRELDLVISENVSHHNLSLLILY